MILHVHHLSVSSTCPTHFALLNLYAWIPTLLSLKITPEFLMAVTASCSPCSLLWPWAMLETSFSMYLSCYVQVARVCSRKSLNLSHVEGAGLARDSSNCSASCLLATPLLSISYFLLKDLTLTSLALKGHKRSCNVYTPHTLSSSSGKASFGARPRLGVRW